MDHKSLGRRKKPSTLGSTPLLQRICQHSESALIKTKLLCVSGAPHSLKIREKKLKYKKSTLDIVPSTHDSSTKSQTCYNNNYFLTTIGYFRVPKTLTFEMRLGAQPFLWKWVLFAWEWKMISSLKAEHLPSFWNRGPGGTRKWPFESYSDTDKFQ